MKTSNYIMALTLSLFCGIQAQAENHKSAGFPQRASDLIGMEVRNTADEKLGKVEDLIVSLGSGRASYIILSSGGAFGVGDQLLVVPTRRFDYQANDKKLVLDVNKDQLKNAPAYEKNKLPDWNDEKLKQRLDEYYGDTPDRSGRSEVRSKDEAGDRSKRPDRLETAEGQGTSDVDLKTTRDIRRRLVESDRLSTGAKNVQVITRNGGVLLRGTVKSEQEREEVVATAKRVAGTTYVTDKLEVTP